MNRGKRLLLYALAGGALAAALVFAAVLLLTRTDYGQERVRGYTVRWLADRVEGELRIGRLTSEGTILGAVTLHDFSLLDPGGRPFVRADSARLRYDWRTLVSGAVVLDRVELFGADIVIERLPGWERWNYERAIVGPEEEEREQPGPGTLVLLQELSLRDGHVVVRYPWEPKPGRPVQPADTARLILEREDGALMRVMRFQDVQAELPRLLVESPDQEGRLFQFSSLAMRAWIWETPMELQHLEGTLTMRDSLLAFEADRVRLPSSRASLLGEVTVGKEDIRMDVRVVGDTVALRDLQWLYPGLPEEGGGSLVFRMQSQGNGNTLWYAERLDISTPGTNLAGSFGIVTGDTLYFTRVSLRAAPLDVALLESLLPVELPVRGLLAGT
ncbi:MAG TPA: hypothetical protein VMK65_12280, partial [Longimicrobiales bacterium]|nr:hypothetical protein [Longimicrobiales bacterium]